LSERWWKKRKRKHPWFGYFFEEPNRLEKLMEQKPRKAYEFGLSVTLGPYENPHIREFRKPQPSYYGPEIQEEREPLVDVVEEDKEVVIVAELPGVEKEDIKLHGTEKALTISVDTPQRKYYKELALPVEIAPESAVATYKNGVLQVSLKKLVDTQPFTK